MAQNETSYNKIIGITKDKGLAVLEYTFEDSEDFKGAVGYFMSTITQDYIDSRKSFDNAEEYLWRDEVSSGTTELGFEEWWEELVEEQECYGYLFPYDDNSYRYGTECLYEELSDEDRAKVEEVLGVYGEDYVTFNCSSGGRCFSENMEWELLLESELWEEIKRVEHREPTRCKECGKEIGAEDKYEPIYHIDNKAVCEKCHEVLSAKREEEQRERTQALVKNYLADLPKEEVINLFLDRVYSYNMQDICEKATGDKSDWVHLKN